LIEIAERVAEGRADGRERQMARTAAMGAGWHPDPRTRHARGPAKATVFWALARRPYEAALNAASYALSCEATFPVTNWGEVSKGQTGQERVVNHEARRAPVRSAHASLLRCIFANPFRPLPSFAASLLAGQDQVVVRLAQATYDERLWPSGYLDPARLAVLADALEENGADADLLDHHRDPGPHVRGCFVIDLLTGRK
jgi:hypothetical protein